MDYLDQGVDYLLCESEQLPVDGYVGIQAVGLGIMTSISPGNIIEESNASQIPIDLMMVAVQSDTTVKEVHLRTQNLAQHLKIGYESALDIVNILSNAPVPYEQAISDFYKARQIMSGAHPDYVAAFSVGYDLNLLHAQGVYVGFRDAKDVFELDVPITDAISAYFNSDLGPRGHLRIMDLIQRRAQIKNEKEIARAVKIASLL